MKFISLPVSGRGKAILALLLLAVLLPGIFLLFGRAAPPPAAPAGAKAALSVSLIAPRHEQWARSLAANGNVVAWQEAVIGAEIGNYRITEVAAQVGDRVRKGQVLARIASDTVASELAEAQATVAELDAAAGEARGNRQRAAELKARGFYSTQLNIQYQTAEHTAEARLAAARARLQAAALKMAKTRVLAPDDGLISGRAASVGSLTQNGQELFRLIRGGRLEWQAEVPAADLAALRPGQAVSLADADGGTVAGVLRAIGPSIDPQTRNGLVYVDLPPSPALRAGMFARGRFLLGDSPALTVPQSAVVRRDGFAYVFRLEAGNRVAQNKVELGRQVGGRIEIVGGLAESARIVASGGGFLADGDLVKVVADGGQTP